MSERTDETAPDRGSERFTEPHADRPPTVEEERAAEKAAKDVDLDDVAEHYSEMEEIGKNVKGEGDLYPSE